MRRRSRPSSPCNLSSSLVSAVRGRKPKTLCPIFATLFGSFEVNDIDICSGRHGTLPQPDLEAPSIEDSGLSRGSSALPCQSAESEARL